MRALLIVLNGAGAGPAPDAARYRDEGANTLAHLIEYSPDLELPALSSLGLGEILGNQPSARAAAAHGRMRARSPGKDSTIAHWEIAGVISHESFATYERFPESLVRELEAAAKVKFLGNDARNNGAIPAALGSEHFKTGRPILGALPGSAMQISAHESVIPQARLFEIARIARKHCNTHRISRVVAQPFASVAGQFTVAAAPREFPAVPPRTVLNAISEAGLHVDGIGAVDTIFAKSGITRHLAAANNDEALTAVGRAWDEERDGLIFASLGGLGAHGRARRLRAFAEALHHFDEWLAGFLDNLEPDDLVIITADQGSDPTFPGTGSTREEVPLFAIHDGKTDSLGIRLTLADVGATLAAYFHLREPWKTGTPFFKFPRPGHLSRR